MRAPQLVRIPRASIGTPDNHGSKPFSTCASAHSPWGSPVARQTQLLRGSELIGLCEYPAEARATDRSITIFQGPAPRQFSRRLPPGGVLHTPRGVF